MNISKRKTLLMIEGRETIGGGQVMTKIICDSLSSEYDIINFIPGNKHSEISKYLRGYKRIFYNNKTYNHGKKTLSDIFKFIINFFSISTKLIKTELRIKSDIVYVQHLSLLPICVFISLFTRRKIIAHVHVFYIDKRARWIIDFFLRSNLVIKIIGVSKYSISQFSSSIRDKAEVLHNPVISKADNSKKTITKDVAIIGDVCWQKGQHVLFEALNNLDGYFIHVIGNIVDSKYKEELELKFINLSFVFTGMIDDVSEYLVEKKISFTVVASISKFETYSLAMVESWELGIPTIATCDFGMKELVEEYFPKFKDSMLFTLGSSSELRKKIIALENNPKSYKEISVAVRKVADEHLCLMLFKKELVTMLSNL